MALGQPRKKAESTHHNGRTAVGFLGLVIDGTFGVGLRQPPRAIVYSCRGNPIPFRFRLACVIILPSSGELVITTVMSTTLNRDN